MVELAPRLHPARCFRADEVSERPTIYSASANVYVALGATWSPNEQVAKAEKAVAGKIPVKRNRFIHLAGATKTVNRGLEAKARALAGIKDTSPTSPTPPPSS